MNNEAAVAVATRLETLMPPLGDLVEEMSRAEASRQPDDLGPVVTVPAVYVQIVTSAFKAERLERQQAAMIAKIESAARKPKAAMSEDEMTALAIHLAAEARTLSFAPLEGVAALWHAVGIFALASLPADQVLDQMDDMHGMIRDDVAKAIGSGATKQ